ncbi:MAG: peptidylprolyl isomerase [Campylobacterota bacterium]|nr:peptidylprolyl isomerase [Campylobacterota bacterium]
MQKITKNTLVSISLKIESKENELIDDSEELMYLHGGYGQIFKKLEDELDGKTIGDKFSLLLSPIDAFGKYDESLVVKESLANLPEETSLGMELDSDDETTVWVVEDITDGYATLNANHELAGLPLKVSGEVLELEQLTDDGVKEILNMEHEH